jgi:hypothetical protein
MTLRGSLFLGQEWRSPENPNHVLSLPGGFAEGTIDLPAGWLPTDVTSSVTSLIAPNQAWSLELGLLRPGDVPGIAAASVFLRGHVDGEIRRVEGNSRWSGSYRAHVEEVEIRDWVRMIDVLPDGVREWAEQWNAGRDPVPMALLDQFRDPARVWLEGMVVGGHESRLESQLVVVTSAVPIPEPAPIVVMALGGLFVGLCRMRKRARTRASR